MSVIIENKCGWLIDHKAFYDNIYRRCFESDCVINLKFKSEFFEINSPFLMNSAAAKEKERCLSGDQQKKKKKRKKREDNSIYHHQVKPLIKEAVDILCSEGKNIGFLEDGEVSPFEWFQNNAPAKSAAQHMNCKCRSCDECQRFTECCADGSDYFENSKDCSIIKTIGLNKYVIPFHSSYYLGDVKNILKILAPRQYDAVLLDPPWKNKSVKRKKGYMTMENDDFLNIPISYLTKPGSLVIIWATNNEEQINFIKEKLFEAWSVRYCVTWHWAKVTKKGTLVCPIDSHQKKPYENIIVGRVKCDGNMTEENDFLEANRVIVSIPSSIHSHKPPLTDILKRYLPEGAECLELFARYLLPGWTSYGNEVLKLQNLQLFEKMEVTAVNLL